MTQPDTTEFARLLVRLRRERGYSQGQLAVRARCTRPYVTLLEGGERTRPSRELALRLAHALGLSGEERRAFLAVAGHPESEATPDGAGADVFRLAVGVVDTIPSPSVLHDSTWTVRHANGAALGMFAALGRGVPPGLSLLELVFDVGYRGHFPVWEPWARHMLAQFKRDSLHARRDEAYHALLARLGLLPDFVRLWRHVDPAADATPVMPVAFALSPYGTFHLNVVRMQFVNTPELWGIVFLPGDEAGERFIGSAR
ncbi:helix-turn-helix domain-containing protein [Deinococcus planocerae]|uniref:MmyB family transcriptional regulator n=1 Tax=Deinococcus planocerae TaxID=1737569 RepID=UPI000C7F2129|nr:helix-turn-helix domain-containing protein [Deinococcus planocerae]